MTTGLEAREEKRNLDRSTSRNEGGHWARAGAALGVAAWVGLAIAARAGIARIGGIELMFLFAPLVVVPLGMELGRILELESPILAQTARERWGIHVDLIARRAQPFAAACAVVAILLPPGTTAGLVACGWLAVCVLAGGSGVIHSLTLWSDVGGRARGTFIVATIVARVDLVVGGSWLVASRLGMHAMGIQEPIGLLTAVHFHFAGFATAMIAAAMLRFADGQAHERWRKLVVAFVLGMPYVVAIGFVVSAGLKMVAALIFSTSVAALAVLLRSYGSRAQQREARVLLQIAAGAVFAGMVLSSVYAVADLVGSDMLTIPQMARTHGILNAVGFCMMALLGWVIEFDGKSQENNSTKR